MPVRPKACVRDASYKRSHNLKKQEPDLSSLAASYGRTLSPAFRHLLGRWNKDDPMGMKGRYPVNMDGKNEELKHSSRFELAPIVAECEEALVELRELLELVAASWYQRFL
jgi:hypothetical protein